MTQNSKIKTQLATLILYLINKMQVLVLCLPAACCSINQFICKGFNLTNLTSPFLNNNAMQGCIKEWVWERRDPPTSTEEDQSKRRSMELQKSSFAFHTKLQAGLAYFSRSKISFEDMYHTWNMQNQILPRNSIR